MFRRLFHRPIHGSVDTGLVGTPKVVYARSTDPQSAQCLACVAALSFGHHPNCTDKH